MYGKILVCLHFAFSLILFSWALVVYTNQMDWGQSNQPDSELVVRKAEYETLTKNPIHQTDFRRRTHRQQLQQHEYWRPIERAWYIQQIEFLNTGATEDNPVRQVERTPDGNPIVVDNPAAGAELLQMGPTKDLRDGQPIILKSFVYYTREFTRVLEDEKREFMRRQEAARRDRQATEQLSGPKGVHARLRHEYEKQEKIKEMQQEVRPAWLNAKIELQNLENLRSRLEVRWRELGSRAGRD